MFSIPFFVLFMPQPSGSFYLDPIAKLLTYSVGLCTTLYYIIPVPWSLILFLMFSYIDIFGDLPHFFKLEDIVNMESFVCFLLTLFNNYFMPTIKLL